MTAPLCFIDTETTSLAGNRRAWEVAMIRVEPDSPDGIGRGVSFFISDVDLRHADQAALRIGRFYERHPKFSAETDAVTALAEPRPAPATVADRLRQLERMRTEYQAAAIIERWVRDAVVIGSNPGFDTEVLEPLLARHGLTPAWHYRPVDVATLAAGYLHGMHATVEFLAGAGQDPEALAAHLGDALVEPDLLEVPWSSDALSRAVGLPPVPEEERHTAMGDTRWCQRLYNLITTGRIIPPLPQAEIAAGGAR